MDRSSATASPSLASRDVNLTGAPCVICAAIQQGDSLCHIEIIEPTFELAVAALVAKLRPERARV